MTPLDPFAAPTNRLQRWWLARMLPRYRRTLDGDALRLIVERDRFLLGPRALGLWVGMVCAIAGTTAGLVGNDLAPVPAFLSALAIVLAFAKAAARAWIQPQRFTARRLWPIAMVSVIATYAGALATFRHDLVDLHATGLGWGHAVLLTAWRATPLQIMLLVNALLILAIVSGARRQYLQRVLDAARADQAREAAERQATQARLSVLQAQIQPHFLFNTLATVQHWVDTQDPRSGPLLRHLTVFLRRSISLLERSSATLADEALLTADYLQIMQARLGDRLRVAIDVAPDAADAVLPPGVLLTLAENAIEHGIEPALHGGSLRVTARRLHGAREGVLLQVANGGQPLPMTVVDGVGLANSRERLRGLSESATLALRAATAADLPADDNAVTIAQVWLPSAHLGALPAATPTAASAADAPAPRADRSLCTGAR